MSNIKINKIDAFNLEVQPYNESEVTLLVPSLTNFQFETSTDFIEAKIYDSSKNLIYSDGEFSDDGIYSYFSISDNNVQLNIENFVDSLGYGPGDYYIVYNFYRKICSNNNMNRFEYYVAEVDNTRTEIKVRLINNDSEDIKESVSNFIKLRSESSTFVDFIVSFGTSNLLANNIKINEDSKYLELYIKLYEPLPLEFNTNSKLLLISEINDPVGYSIKYEMEEVESVPTTERISKPNFNINITNYSTIDSKELSLIDIQADGLFDIKNQFQSLISDNKYKINIDYNNFKNFIHYSSAFKRIFNFTKKLRLIQSNEYQLGQLTLKDTHNKSLVDSMNDIIKDIIGSFDGYEYFLYYNLYPKNSLGKLENFLVDVLDNSENSQINPLVESWYNSYCDEALEYDENNLDNLYWNIPEYLRDDPQNYPYRLFIEMIGHSFDDIWVYIRNIKDLYKGDNRVNFGISKELLTELLNNFGLKLYNGNYSTQDLYSSFLGTKKGVIPYALMSFDLQPGSELITDYIDVEGGDMPLNDVEYRIFKRLYHNLPYLYKGRGTIGALRTLIGIYGIPEGTLTIEEFGNDEKISINENPILDEVLVPNQSLQQIEYSDTIDDKFKKHISVGVSPQDQINKDIAANYGDIDYNDLLGDTRKFRSGENQYVDLRNGRAQYFERYVKSYNLKDFVRLARFLNNSLFKMIRDFVPASSTVSTGVIIKQHDLEVIKTNPIDLDLEFIQYETLMKSFSRDYRGGNINIASDDRDRGSSIEVTSGGTGGSLEVYNGIGNHPYYADKNYGRDQVIQSWDEPVLSKVGPLVIKRDDQKEFYNGELGLPIKQKSPEICRVHFSNEYLKDWRYDVSFYGGESDTTIEEEFLQSNFNLEEGKLQIFLSKTKFDDKEFGEHYAPKYIKISNETLFPNNSIDDFIISNSFMTLSFESINVWMFNIAFNKWIKSEINDGRSFKFTFYNVIKKNNTYLIILDQNNTDHVSGYVGGEVNNVTIFKANGDYVWRSYDFFGDTPFKTIPQGYFPKTLPDEYKTQYFRGYVKAPYFEGNNLIAPSPLNDVIGTHISDFNKGTTELDGDAYNGLEYVGDLVNSKPSKYPWFMNGGGEFLKIESNDFELRKTVVQSGVGPITYLGIEFIPLGNINYSNIHSIMTNFPGSNTLDGTNKASLDININSQFLNSYEANNIKTYTSPVYPGDIVRIVLNNAIIPNIPPSAPSTLRTRIYNIGDNVNHVAEINGTPTGNSLVSIIDTSLYPDYGGIKTEAFRSPLIEVYPDVRLIYVNHDAGNTEQSQTVIYQLIILNKPFIGKVKIEGESIPAINRFSYSLNISNSTYNDTTTANNKIFTEITGESGGTIKEFPSPGIPIGTYNILFNLTNGGANMNKDWDARVFGIFELPNGVNATDGQMITSYSRNVVPT